MSLTRAGGFLDEEIQFVLAISVEKVLNHLLVEDEVFLRQLPRMLGGAVGPGPGICGHGPGRSIGRALVVDVVRKECRPTRNGWIVRLSV